MTPEIYSLDEKNQYIVLNPDSVGLKPDYGRETFFKIIGTDNCYICNMGYVLEITDTGYKKILPDDNEDVQLTYSDGTTKAVNIYDLILDMYFTVEDMDAVDVFPQDGNYNNKSMKNIVPLTSEQEAVLVKNTFHPEGEIAEKLELQNMTYRERAKAILKDFKGSNASPIGANSFYFFGIAPITNNYITTEKGNMYDRVKNKYENVAICDEWGPDEPDANDNFRKWCMKNYYYHPQKLHLDKDILCIGENQIIYSPSTCLFITNDINKIFKQANIADMLSDNMSNNETYINDLTKVIDYEKSLEPKINHAAHRKLIEKLEKVLEHLNKKKEKYSPKK